MKRKFFISISAIFFLINFASFSFSADFGKNIQVKKDLKNIILIADFNGDQLKDTVVLLEIGANSLPLKECAISNPWYGKSIRQDGEPLSIGIISSNKALNKPSLTIIHDSSFFSTPIWTSNKIPIDIVTKGTAKFKQWKETVSDLKNDAIVLGTEAGIDILIYWNGKAYMLFQPNEEP